MKKLVAAVAAVVMAFAMAVPAFAAESPGTSNEPYQVLDVKGDSSIVVRMDSSTSEAQDLALKVDEIAGSFSDELKAMGLDNTFISMEGLYQLNGDASKVGLRLADAKYGVGEVAYALQLKADGTWSIVELVRNDDDYYYGAFDKDAKAFAWMTGIVKNYVDTKVESADPDKITVTELSDLEYANAKDSFDANKSNIDTELSKKGYNAESLEIVGFFDVSRTDGSKDGTKVTLLVDKSAPEGKKYVVLHQKADGTWEVLEVTASKDGKQLTVDFPSFSNVVLALVSDPLYQTADGKGTSPKTGDNGAVAVIVDALA